MEWSWCSKIVKVTRVAGAERGEERKHYLGMKLSRGARLHRVLRPREGLWKLLAGCNRKPLESCEQGPAC